MIFWVMYFSGCGGVGCSGGAVIIYWIHVMSLNRFRCLLSVGGDR